MPEPTYTITDSTADSLTLQRATSETGNENQSLTLEEYIGKTISDICTNGYTASDISHCAHFVSHVKEYAFTGTRTCAQMRYDTRNNKGACIRVNEVFKFCPQVGKWADKPEDITSCLAFVTLSTNVRLRDKFMSDHPKKHIGIYQDGMIYHYSNSQDVVVKQSPEDFSKHYTGPNVEVYYGTFPQ